MSRGSSASSPSGTSGGINLAKEGDTGAGQKTQPSASSGGIGLTQEVGQVGGMSVTGGVSVDVSPIEIDISGTVDASDPSKNSISIAGSAELPGGLIGLGGGVKINTNTGAVQGGSISGEIGGFGVEVSADSEEGLGITLSYQIPFTPIVISLGFGQAKKEEPTSTPTLPNTSTPRVTGIPLPSPKACNGGKYVLADVAVYYNSVADYRWGGWREYRIVEAGEFLERWMQMFDDGFYMSYGGYNESATIERADRYFGLGQWDRLIIDREEIRGRGSWLWNNDSWHEDDIPRQFNRSTLGLRYCIKGLLRYQFFLFYPKGLADLSLARFWFTSSTFNHRFEVLGVEPPPPCYPGELPPLLPPPNPPPRKEMDECCRESIRMLRNLTMVMQVRSVLEGKVQIPGELIAVPEEGKALPPEVLRTYPEMINAILLTVNRHGMDGPITVEIEDTDKTAAGNQEAVYTYNSPAVAMQAALEMLHEIKAAGNARLSIQIGIAFAVTRILKIAGGIGESIREIIKMLGLPFRYKSKKMPLEFNLAGVKKGYGKDSKPKEFSEMSKEELENIIPTLLEGSECDIPVPTFAPSESDDIRQMLCKLTIRKDK